MTKRSVCNLKSKSDNKLETTRFTHPISYDRPRSQSFPMNPSLRRPQNYDSLILDSTSLSNSSRHETRYRHPRVPTLVISDWSIDWLLIGCWLVNFIFGPINWQMSYYSFWFFTPGYQFDHVWLSISHTSHWIVVFWICFGPIRTFVSFSAF